MSSIVESPETEKRQSNSVPNSKPPDSQATRASNKDRARKKVTKTAAKNSIWFKSAMRKSRGW